MPQLLGEITREALLAYAAEQGSPITPDQLVRWHQNELLPRPQRRGLGRGRGMQSIYPASAAAQAVALSKARKGHRSLDLMAWAVWLEGFPLTQRVKGPLLAQLDSDIARLTDLLTALSSLDETDETVYKQLVAHRAPGLGRVLSSDRETVYRVILEILLDPPELLEDYDDVGRRAVVSAFLPRPLRSPKNVQMLPTALTEVTHAMNLPRARRMIAEASDAELESGRDAVLRFWRLFQGQPDEVIADLPPHVFAVGFSVLSLLSVREVFDFMDGFLRQSGYASFNDVLHALRGKR